MKTISQIEQQIVRRLKTAFAQTKVSIEPYPADLQTYIDNFRAVQGGILVQFTERKRDYTHQRAGKQTVTFEIAVVSRDLKEHSGAYAILDKVFAALSGVDLTETETVAGSPPTVVEQPIGIRLYCVSEQFATYLPKNGLWIYAQTWESDPFGFIVDETEEGVITEFTLKNDAGVLELIPDPEYPY